MALVRAKTAFFMANRQLVSEGVILDASHPIVARHGDHFEPVDQSPGFDAPIESATASPGEKRSTVARNRKPADTEESED